jgi:hypothetical protein
MAAILRRLAVEGDILAAPDAGIGVLLSWLPDLFPRQAIAWVRSFAAPV